MRRRVVVPFATLLMFATFGICQPPHVPQHLRHPIHVTDSPAYDLPDTVADCDSPENEAKIKDEDAADQMADRNAHVRAAESDVLNLERVYLSKIQTGRSWIYTGLDVLNLAATAAGGAVGGPTAAKELVLTATGIAGVKSSFVTNFDAGGNASSLVGKIQTTFASNQVLLEQNLNLAYSSYPLSTACFDVQALYDSGQKVSTGAKVPARAALPPNSELPHAVFH